ncbi:MAG: RNA polymerase Rpb4 family protein [Thermoplasmata archaeon]|nr:RNA polymerase Rpb4 family protein [Thermoplasmata archaeon]
MEQRYVSVAEVKDLLEAESEARGYEFMLASQKAALDHAQKTCSISKEQADAIMEAANALDFVTENVAVKIADLLPEYPEDVRAIFAKERVTLEKEQIEAVLEIVRNNS